MKTRRLHFGTSLLAMFLLFAGLVSACSDAKDGGRVPRPAGPRELELRLDLAANLEPFDDCDELLDYFVETAEDFAAQGLPRGVIIGGTERYATGQALTAEDAVGGSATAAPSATPEVAETGGGAAFSGTNVQEEGVDEPDIVKTDGELIAVVAQGRLFLVEPDGAGTRVVGSLALPEGGHEIFLHGDRVIVLTRSWHVVALGGAERGGSAGGAVATDVLGPGTSTTVVTAVDISDPARPAVAQSATFEGDYVSARLHEGVVRLVLQSGWTYVPEPAESSVRDWLADQIEGSEPTEDQLVPCDAVTRPPEPAGGGTVTVLTIDAAASMEPIDTDAVVASAQTIYASTDTLYVATNQWFSGGDVPSDDTSTTELHAFDIADPEQTTYLASGRVRGQLLNQWSLSEHDGHLRVATTDGSPWAPDGGAGDSESFLTVLERASESLETVGQVGGLGKGETIQAVRFIGALGFVVTFRQTDPLYALDLSDPRAPRVLGELKVPGFSAYLHPIRDDRLLGVGQDATDEGQTIGTQVSLFDTSDLANLRRLDNQTIAGASSAVEFDHKAFLWWAQRDLAVVPIDLYGPSIPVPGDALAPDPAPVEAFSGIVAFRVEGDDVEQVGRVTHAGRVGSTDDYYGAPGIQRTLVVGDGLYSVSEAGVMASDLSSLAEEGWAGF